MEIEKIENYCENISKKIVKILLKKYDSSDFEMDSLVIEKEIYELALSYSTISIFESECVITNKNDLISIINSRYNIKNSKLNKMSTIELLAHVIKLYIIRSLEDSGIFFV